MKKTINTILLASSILLLSCSNNVSCSSKTAISKLKKTLSKTIMATNRAPNMDESFVTNFFKENVKFSSITTVNKEDNIKKCSCNIQLTFDLPNKFIKTQVSKIREAEDYKFASMADPNNELGLKYNTYKDEILNGKTLYYEVQKTEDSEEIISIYKQQAELNGIITSYGHYLGKIPFMTLEAKELSEALKLSTARANRQEKIRKEYDKNKAEREANRAIEREAEREAADIKYKKQQKIDLFFKINVDNLRVRKSPYLDGEKLENLEIGSSVESLYEKSSNTTTVTIKGIDIEDSWYKIRTPNGNIGWIHGCCFDRQ